MPAKSKPAPELRLRFRLMLGKDIALGPGKAELLKRIRDTGSIRVAAYEMGMSYMRAWTLVQTMNRCFKEPVVLSSRGGTQRGGATLTSNGEKVLALYAEFEERSRQATANLVSELQALLDPKSNG